MHTFVTYCVYALYKPISGALRYIISLTLLSIYLQIFYLDWLHHHEGPVNRLTIPRISAFTDEMITKLIAADVIRDSHAIVGYGALLVCSQSPSSCAHF
jgi:hypothetical protein